MACGTPVVAAKIQVLVEIADKAVLFADPKKPEDMAEKISELLENSELRAQLIRKGGERAKEFSWDKTAKETIDLYHQVIGG
jgi:glycosyltransferase involved in cell wall biosynthesis